VICDNRAAHGAGHPNTRQSHVTDCSRLGGLPDARVPFSNLHNGLMTARAPPGAGYTLDMQGSSICRGKQN